MTVNKTMSDLEAGTVDLERYLPQMLNSVSAQMNERLAQELRTIDLPLAYWRILAILRWRGDCTLKDIHSWTVIDTSTASRAVKRLEEEGAVLRRWDKSDTRNRRISITEEGEAMFNRGWTIVSGFHDYLMQDLDARELELITVALEKLQYRLRRSIWDERKSMR